MGCRKYKKVLNEAAAGQLPPEQRRWLDDHLLRCAACAARLEQRRQTLAAIDSALLEAAEIEPSPHLLVGVQRRLTEQAETHARPRLSLRLAAATALSLALIAAWTLRPRHSSPPRRAAVSSLTTPSAPRQPMEQAADRSVSVIRTEVKPAAAEGAGAGRARLRKPPERPGISTAGVVAFAPVKVQPERDAVIRFYQLLQAGKLTPRSLPVSASNDTGKISVAPLQIRPLVIQPLEAPAQATDTLSPSPIREDGQDPHRGITRR